VIHLVVRFTLELAAVVAAGIVGASVGDPSLGIPGAVVAVLAFAAVWAMWIAPRARRPLAARTRLVVGTALMLAAAVGLVLVGHPTVGEILAAAIAANAVLLAATGAWRLQERAA
jgi:hypothetical protein